MVSFKVVPSYSWTDENGQIRTLTPAPPADTIAVVGISGEVTRVLPDSEKARVQNRLFAGSDTGKFVAEVLNKGKTK